MHMIYYCLIVIIAAEKPDHGCVHASFLLSATLHLNHCTQRSNRAQASVLSTRCRSSRRLCRRHVGGPAEFSGACFKAVWPCGRPGAGRGIRHSGHRWACSTASAHHQSCNIQKGWVQMYLYLWQCMYLPYAQQQPLYCSGHRWACSTASLHQ